MKKEKRHLKKGVKKVLIITMLLIATYLLFDTVAERIGNLEESGDTKPQAVEVNILKK